MFKSELLKKVKEVYEGGGNIIQFINEQEKNEANSKEAILISYDFQAGSYVSEYKKNPEPRNLLSQKCVDELVSIINGGGGRFANTFGGGNW